jgi:transposase
MACAALRLMRPSSPFQKGISPGGTTGVGAVRKSEYGRLAGRDRRYIKGQKYTLLSRRENLTLDGKKALKTLLAANKRLNTAYVLKESFGQLWSYEREGRARRFFEPQMAAPQAV